MVRRAWCVLGTAVALVAFMACEQMVGPPDRRVNRASVGQRVHKAQRVRPARKGQRVHKAHPVRLARKGRVENLGCPEVPR